MLVLMERDDVERELGSGQDGSEMLPWLSGIGSDVVLMTPGNFQAHPEV